MEIGDVHLLWSWCLAARTVHTLETLIDLPHRMILLDAERPR
jgi:hypothetical protein